MASSPSFWVSEMLWYCHMCTCGPYNYNLTTRCTNVLGNGHMCQHEICPQCRQYKMSVARHPNRPASGPQIRPANPVESDIAKPEPKESTSPASVMPTFVSQENSSIREFTTLEDSTADSEISSDTGPQATSPSDTSSDNGTNDPWQADLNVVNSVARRLFGDWASQYRTAGTRPTSDVRTHASGSRASEAPIRRSQSGSTGSQDVGGTLKRSNIPDGGDDDDTNEESRKRRRQQSNHDPEENASIIRLLACPYHKYDPQRYSERNVTEKEYRGCASCYITDINRLKQHLYRVHQKPNFCCSRCFELFASATFLEDHTRQQPACDVLAPNFTERMTEDQLRSIKRKQQGRNVEQKWFHIFGTLFPDATPPKSPYLGDDSVQAGLNDFMRYFRQHAPSMLNDEIRSGLTSTDLGFRVEYLLDLILQDAVTQVAQRLLIDHSFGRSHETVRPDSMGAGSETYAELTGSPTDTPNPTLPTGTAMQSRRLRRGDGHETQ